MFLWGGHVLNTVHCIFNSFQLFYKYRNRSVPLPAILFLKMTFSTQGMSILKCKSKLWLSLLWLLLNISWSWLQKYFYWGGRCWALCPSNCEVLGFSVDYLYLHISIFVHNGAFFVSPCTDNSSMDKTTVDIVNKFSTMWVIWVLPIRLFEIWIQREMIWRGFDLVFLFQLI